MENNKYEQEFIKNIKQTEQPILSSYSSPKTTASILQLTITIILVIIVLIESIALTIFAINYGEVLGLYGGYESEYDAGAASDSPEALSENSNFNYDKDYNITAFNLICIDEDGAKYTFTKSETYQKTDSFSNLIDSGSYSIIKSGAVVLDSSSKSEGSIVYYDGYSIIEGTTFYICEET